jgi:hypothetical protein
MYPLLAFIDASIYEGLNFQTESEPLSLLLELSNDGYVVLLDHPLAKRELFKRIEKRSQECVREVLALRKKIYLARGSAAAPFKQIFSDFKHEALKSELRTRLERFLGGVRREAVLEDPKALSRVLELYFADLPPFDLEEKKHEFPDALVINDLCKAADTNGQIIHVVSADGDFERALRSDSRFVLHKTLESLLRELYGRKGKSNEAAIRLVSRSMRKLKTLLAKAFAAADLSSADRAEIAVTHVHVDKVVLSKITQTRYRELQGHYRTEAEFFFSMELEEGLEYTTETGGIPPFNVIVEPDSRRLTIPCSFAVRFNTSLSRIAEWKKITLNNGGPISL